MITYNTGSPVHNELFVNIRTSAGVAVDHDFTIAVLC
jgi:hypothetical protein